MIGKSISIRISAPAVLPIERMLAFARNRGN